MNELPLNFLGPLVDGVVAYLWMGMISGGVWLAIREAGASSLDKPTLKTAFVFAIMGPFYVFTALLLLPFYFIYRIAVQTYREANGSKEAM